MSIDWKFVGSDLLQAQRATVRLTAHASPARQPQFAESLRWGQAGFSVLRLLHYVHDNLHRYCQGQNGGKSPQTAYRQYVQVALGEADNPLKEAWREWALGSAADHRQPCPCPIGSAQCSRKQPRVLSCTASRRLQFLVDGWVNPSHQRSDRTTGIQGSMHT